MESGHVSLKLSSMAGFHFERSRGVASFEGTLFNLNGPWQMGQLLGAGANAHFQCFPGWCGIALSVFSLPVIIL